MALLQLIRSGESEFCEFKPWIDLGNQKAGDLEKSVYAFSNYKGGTLLIGVSMEAEIVGLAREVTKRPDELPKALAEFEKSVRRRLNETLKNSLCVESHLANVEGQSIHVLDVLPVDELNYVIASNTAYVRRGATSAKMSPPEFQATVGAARAFPLVRP